MKYIDKQQEPQSLSDYNQKKRQKGDHILILLTILLLTVHFVQNQSFDLLIRSILKLSKEYQQIRPKYKKYPNKNHLREALLKEQGYICCYCLGRIQIGSMSVEHWLPKSKFNVFETDYNNLLGCCQGGGSAKNPNENRHHCGVMKADKIIKINPIDTNFEEFELKEGSGYDLFFKALEAATMDVVAAVFTKESSFLNSETTAVAASFSWISTLELEELLFS